jgi:hypothetical protein
VETEETDSGIGGADGIGADCWQELAAAIAATDVESSILACDEMTR